MTSRLSEEVRLVGRGWTIGAQLKELSRKAVMSPLAFKECISYENHSSNTKNHQQRHRPVVAATLKKKKITKKS